MDEDLRLFHFHCDCGDSALAVYHDPEDEDYPYISLAFWKWGHAGSAYDRLRHIWYIIRYGHHYEDEVILTAEAAGDLADHLWCIAQELEAAEDIEDIYEEGCFEDMALQEKLP